MDDNDKYDDGDVDVYDCMTNKDENGLHSNLLKLANMNLCFNAI